MIVYKWKAYCNGCQKYFYPYGPNPPTKCPDDPTHVLDPALITERGKFFNSTNDLVNAPQGSGFKKPAPPLTDFVEGDPSWSFTIASGRKVVMLKSHVLANLALQGLPNIVFEVLRYLPLAGGGVSEYYVIDQSYYASLSALAVESDEKRFTNTGEGVLMEVMFNWPQFDDVSRKPTILYGDAMDGTPDKGDILKVYLTDDVRRFGEGVLGDTTKESYELGGVTLYNPYGANGTPPTWPVEVALFKPNHICFHAISFAADQVLIGE